jgi:hypothetical protein
MTKEEALTKIEYMTNKEFHAFFESLPARVKLLVKAGMVNWKEVLPEWYIKGLDK